MIERREYDEIQQVRRSVGIIGCVELASLLINFLLHPLTSRLPVFADGSFGAEMEGLILYLIVFALPFCAAARLSGTTMRELMGQGKPPASIYLMTIGLTLGWSFTASWMGGGIESILNGFGLTEVSQSYILPTSSAAMVIQFLSIAVIPPIVEEMCYRGFYLNVTLRSMGTCGAIMLTSVAFWMGHYSIEILPLAFGFGLIGGYIRQRYDSLLPSMCGHFAVNGVYLLVNFGWETGGVRVGTMIAIVVNLAEILLGVVGVVLFVRKGCLQSLWDGTFGNTSALTPKQMTRAVLTSLPVLLIVLSTIYFTARNLEAF